jgi:hypothetical protein
MCKSKRHTTDEHLRRATLGRLVSSKWRRSRRSQAKKVKIWWKKHHKEMTAKRRAQVTPEWCRENGKRLKKQWSDPVWRKKMCRIRKTQSKGNQIRHPQGSWYRTKYNGVNGSFWMRSSWEVAFAYWLDNSGVRWQYESKRFCLGKGRFYTPDFYLPVQNEYVELKGWLTKKDEKKIELFRKLYPDVNLYVFFGKNLKKAQIIPFKKAA